VSKTGKARKTAVAPQIAASLRYAIGQRLRKRIEEGFGWSKAVAGLTRVKARGLAPGSHAGTHSRAADGCACGRSDSDLIPTAV
jgi:hypothetical protein